MCGIVGFIGNPKNNAKFVYEGLKSLEYRGYDSYGMAFLKGQEVRINKNVGMLDENARKWAEDQSCNIGIGHVRWATNGKVNKENAHPHLGGNIALVHNGIIKNVESLNCNYNLQGETDSEVLTHWINDIHLNTDSWNLFFKLKEIQGDYAVLFFKKGLNRLYASCRNIPLYVAKKDNDYYVASSLNVFDEILHSYEFIKLEENSVAIIENGLTVYNQERVSNHHDWIKEESKPILRMEPEDNQNGSITLSEIKEQKKYLFEMDYREYGLNLDKDKKLIMFGCGSSYRAAKVAKYFFRDQGFNNVEVYFPNELRYLEFNKDAQYMAISQSGETKDVLDVVRKVQGKNNIIAITNRVNSTLDRLANHSIYLNCGVEKGVAATKTYTATLVRLLNCASNREVFDYVAKDLNNCLDQIFTSHYPEVPKHWFPRSNHFENIFLFGEGISHHVNMEGSLKLKEMAVVHAEAIYTTEVKHGPLALLNEETSSIFVITDERNEYLLDNVRQVRSRGGKVLILTHKDLDLKGNFSDCHFIYMPSMNNTYYADAFVLSIYWQLIALEIGRLRGTNIDRPQNLAKCVTV